MMVWPLLLASPPRIAVGNTSVTLCTAAIVRVQHHGGPGKVLPRLVVNNDRTSPVPYHVRREAALTTITTSALSLDIFSNGTVRFYTLDSKLLLSELAHDLAAGHTTMAWDSPADESIYGFGQHNFGLIDYRGAPLPLRQWNLWAAVPFFVSTRGFGLLWDTSYAEASFNAPLDSERVDFGAYNVSSPCSSCGGATLPTPQRALASLPPSLVSTVSTSSCRSSAGARRACACAWAAKW
jgi:hypothetical protein